MIIREANKKNNIYNIYYFVIMGLCIVLILLFNMLLNHKIKENKEMMMNKINDYIKTQTYDMDWGMESMLNTVYIQREALERIIASDDGSSFYISLSDVLKYEKQYEASSLIPMENMGNILLEGDITNYSIKEQKELNSMRYFFELQSLLQKYVFFNDSWSVYYSRDGYTVIYPYSSIDDIIEDGSKFEIKERVGDAISSLKAENDPMLLEKGWETGVFYDLANEVIMFSKSLPVRKEDDIEGIVTCNISVEALYNYISKPPLDMDVYMMDNYGQVLYHTGQPINQLQNVQEVFKDKYGIKADEYEQISTNNIKTKGHYFFTSNFTNTGWTLTVVVDADTIEYSTITRLGAVIAGNILILLLGFFIIKILKKYYQKDLEIERIKTDFFMTVSHDLKSPMTHILGYLKTIKDKLKIHNDSDHDLQSIKDNITKEIDIIEKESKRLKSLINNILKLSKLQYGEIVLLKTKIDLREWFKEIIDAVDNEAKEKNICIIIKIEDNIEYLYADQELMSLLLMNLVSNALEATDKGEITLTAYKNGVNNIHIEICDTGCGMTEEAQVKIFDSFMTHKKTGTGLGLTIAKRIVEKHKGFIGCKSKKDIGSTFYFEIPIE